MAKKEAYFWRGRGELKIDKLYLTGAQIPHEKMDKGTFAKMVKDGRIQKTAFDIVASNAESDLKKQVKELSEELVKRNNQSEEDVKPYTDRIEELEGELAEATKEPSDTELTEALAKIEELETKVADLEKDLDEATKGND